MRLKFAGSAPLLAIACAACLIFSGCQTDGTTTAAPTRNEAWRFLTQSTFGPSEQSIQDVTNKGFSGWIDAQFAQAPSISYTDFVTRRVTEMQIDQPGVGGLVPLPNEMLQAFYTRALTDQSQLRARLVFALSEIFVVSMVNEVLGLRATPMVASYLDTLDSSLDGNFRDLLEKVTLSPAMGEYLTYRGNNKEDPSIGRQPDENYAREIMQLFSIGLYQLNLDGTQKLDGNGQPIPTYATADVKGLAKVFTGWGMYRSSSYAALSEDACFGWWLTCRDPAGFTRPMISYPRYHSTSAKSFLGVTIPAQSTPSPEASLKVALDTLANHPNAAPFFSKQLIQRLVTSNPTPAYVARVATRFNATGGNIKEVVKAILLDDEARNPLVLLSSTTGKLREPVLRMTALLRAFKFTSPTMTPSSSPLDASGSARLPYVTLGSTSDSSTSLGQTPLTAPSVFNFFRPGYTPPNPGSSTPVTHVAPEMQLVSESTVTAYANYLMDALPNGLGPSVAVDSDGQCGIFTNATRSYIQGLDAKIAANKAIQTNAASCQIDASFTPDIHFDFSEQRSLAYSSANLVQHVADRLLGGSITDPLKKSILAVLDAMPVPAPDATQSNGAAINDALDQRVRAAVLLVAVSPEFLVTK
jgi:uncharacterized protein (DUF1800 family)